MKNKVLIGPDEFVNADSVVWVGAIRFEPKGTFEYMLGGDIRTLYRSHDSYSFEFRADGRDFEVTSSSEEEVKNIKEQLLNER